MDSVRRYYGVILGRQWLNLRLRHRHHLFQRLHGNGHAFRRHLLDRPDVLGDCPVGENRAMGIWLVIQQAIMVLLQYMVARAPLIR